jgi:hypothetical protein
VHLGDSQSKFCLNSTVSLISMMTNGLVACRLQVDAASPSCGCAVAERRAVSRSEAPLGLAVHMIANDLQNVPA